MQARTRGPTRVFRKDPRLVGLPETGDSKKSEGANMDPNSRALITRAPTKSTLKSWKQPSTIGSCCGFVGPFKWPAKAAPSAGQRLAPPCGSEAGGHAGGLGSRHKSASHTLYHHHSEGFGT